MFGPETRRRKRPNLVGEHSADQRPRLRPAPFCCNLGVMTERRFPAPWTVEKIAGGLVAAKYRRPTHCFVFSSAAFASQGSTEQYGSLNADAGDAQTRGVGFNRRPSYQFSGGSTYSQIVPMTKPTTGPMG